jgi:hypothetical protein
MGAAMETCRNCNRPIGNLETPHVWNGHVVCAACRNALEAGVPRAVPPPTSSSGNWVAAMGFLAMAAGGALMLYTRVVPMNWIAQTNADQLALVCLGGGLGVYLIGRAL